MSEKTTDARLLALVAAGAQHHATELWARHGGLMITMARRCLRSREDADEVAIHAFEKAMRHAGNFRAECQVETWLVRITLNLARNRYWYNRRRRLGLNHSLDEPIPSDFGFSTLAELVPDQNSDHRGEIELRDEEHVIERAKRYLWGQHAEIIAMRDRGLSYDEIAATGRMDVGTVKSRLGRARRLLRGFAEDLKAGVAPRRRTIADGRVKKRLAISRAA